MPTCKNDPSKTFKGTEPSPKGMGWCAHGEKEGKVRNGERWKTVDCEESEEWK